MLVDASTADDAEADALALALALFLFLVGAADGAGDEALEDAAAGAAEGPAAGPAAGCTGSSDSCIYVGRVPNPPVFLGTKTRFSFTGGAVVDSLLTFLEGLGADTTRLLLRLPTFLTRQRNQGMDDILLTNRLLGGLLVLFSLVEYPGTKAVPSEKSFGDCSDVLHEVLVVLSGVPEEQEGVE